jgi:hypothetical protein
MIHKEIWLVKDNGSKQLWNYTYQDMSIVNFNAIYIITFIILILN